MSMADQPSQLCFEIWLQQEQQNISDAQQLIQQNWRHHDQDDGITQKETVISQAERVPGSEAELALCSNWLGSVNVDHLYRR